MLSRSVLVFLACLGSLLIVVIVSIKGNPGGAEWCRIPHESEHGVCVEPSSCPAFQRIQESEANASRQDFIRALQCGRLICCPRSPRESYRRPWIVEGDAGSGELEENGTCGWDRLSDKVSNGNIADMDEFPWAALLIYRKGTPKCGAVLISRKFVLTAAHCLAGEGYSLHGPLKFVRLREYNLETDPDCVIERNEQNETHKDCIEGGKLDKEPVSIKLHPDYDETDYHQYHDIALIKINLTEKYSHFLRPICLPEPGRMNGLSPDEGLMVCGWGLTIFFREDRGIIPSPVKMKARLPFVDRQKCQKRYPNYPLSAGQFCAGGRLQDACAGDSGSPLMYYDRFKNMWVLSGIVSKGPKTCGTVDYPGIYTSVVEYLPWIKNVTGL